MNADLNMNFLIIPVEVKLREFNSRLLLSCFATEEKYKVIFGSQGAINRNIDYIPKGIIFDKSISKNKYKNLKTKLDKGFKIVSLDEEGLTSHENEFIYLKQRVSEKTLNLASKFFTWGKDEYSLIAENFPNFKDKIYITGNPRIDLLNSNFKEIYRDRALNYKKKYGKYVLLPSSFSFKHARGNHFVFKQAKDFGIITNKEEEEIFLDIEGPGGYIEKSYLAHIKMIHKLVRSFPKINFIIRPHPSEEKSSWDNFDEYRNVKIIMKGTIAPWLLGSELSVHNNCTTGLEAYLMGRPVVSYQPYDHKICGRHISNGVSLRAKTEEELVHHVKNILENPDYFKNNLKIWPIFKDIISISEDKFACEKIIEHLNNIDWPINEKNNILIPKIEDFIIIGKRFVAKLLSKISYFKQKYAYGFQKFPGSSLKEITEIVDKYQQISGKFKDIKIEKIANDLYYIHKN